MLFERLRGSGSSVWTQERPKPIATYHRDFGSSMSPVFSDAIALDEIHARLSSDGVAFVGGLQQEATFMAVGKSLGTIFHHRDSDPSGITRLKARILDGGISDLRGFSSQELLPHTDRSTAEAPPDYVFMAAVLQPAKGGDSVLVDGARLHAWIAAHDPILLSHLKEPNSVIFADGNCVRVGSIFTETPDGYVQLRFRADQLGYFGAPLAARLDVLCSGIEECAVRAKLQPGQGVIVDNYRWLHGRTAFVGERELWRLLIDRVAAAEAAHQRGFRLS
jgi:hypothetical protein